ncbi:hypothetical protein XH92_20275 [Bradyrhizobium sp. CCBAU 53421]|nr:hypothetical protein XH92_20275 [Bradyrhizobium sp. CCBAU 53421]
MGPSLEHTASVRPILKSKFRGNDIEGVRELPGYRQSPTSLPGDPARIEDRIWHLIDQIIQAKARADLDFAQQRASGDLRRRKRNIF